MVIEGHHILLHGMVVIGIMAIGGILMSGITYYLIGEQITILITLSLCNLKNHLPRLDSQNINIMITQVMDTIHNQDSFILV